MVFHVVSIPSLPPLIDGVVALGELLSWTAVGLSCIGWILTRPRRGKSASAQTGQLPPITLTESEMEELVFASATESLQIPLENFNVPIEHQLLVSPADLIRFLDDLHIDYRLPVSSDDRSKFVTVKDLVRLIASRLETTTGQK